MPIAESNEQFLARMILNVREQQQINSDDAKRLSDLAQYGRQAPTTMPEERRDPSRHLSATGAHDLVSG